MRFVSIAVLICFALSGCAFFKERYGQKPEISLQEVYFQDPQILSTTMVFVLLVKNPNMIALNVEEITYDIQLDGKSFSKAKVEKKISIPAEGSSKVAIPLPLEYVKVLHGIQEVLTGKDIDYVVTGEAKVSGFSVPFKEAGKINIRDLERKAQ